MTTTSSSRGGLDEAPFSYHTTKDGQVFISWQGQHVTTLRGSKATQFLKRVEAATEAQQQHHMARVTGNFKRGNERGKG